MLSPPTLPNSFGPALRFLRKRARLTQDELGRAVGYSREQIARLENGSRLPDLAVLAALFVPALFQKQETALVEQFLALVGGRLLFSTYLWFAGVGHVWVWMSARPSASRVSAAANPATPELRVSTQGFPFCLQCFFNW